MMLLPTYLFRRGNAFDQKQLGSRMMKVMKVSAST